MMLHCNITLTHKGKIMKIWNYLLSLAESIGKARAATYFTRTGRPEMAKRIMLGD